MCLACVCVCVCVSPRVSSCVCVVCLVLSRSSCFHLLLRCRRHVNAHGRRCCRCLLCGLLCVGCARRLRVGCGRRTRGRHQLHACSRTRGHRRRRRGALTRKH